MNSLITEVENIHQQYKDGKITQDECLILLENAGLLEEIKKQSNKIRTSNKISEALIFALAIIKAANR
jgi:hypothetical protein